MANEAARSPIDGRFTPGRRGPVDHHLPRPAIRAADGGAGNSIASCDYRTRNRVLADSDAVVTGCTTDRDPNPSTANNTTTNGDGDTALRESGAGRDAVQPDESDPDRNPERNPDSYARNHGLPDGRGDSPERWGLASPMLYAVPGDAGGDSDFTADEGQQIEEWIADGPPEWVQKLRQQATPEMEAE